MKTWLILFFTATYCINATAQSKDIKSETFIQYKNENKIDMGMDGAIIKDKFFTLKIPDGLVHSKIIGSTAFKQVLDFKDHAKIILLYIPNADTSSSFTLSEISYREFIRLCSKEDIIDYIDEIDFTRKGFFGMKKLEKGSFYILYLNVKRKQLKLYNYSINSIQF